MTGKVSNEFLTNEGQIVLLENADGVMEGKNALKILAEIAKTKRRFNELQRLFGSPATLTIRLRELEKLKLIKREMEIQEDSRVRRNPAVIYYVVTPKGQRVASIYQEFRKTLSNALKSPLAP